MAEYTTNYNLEKQQGNDNVDISGINNNFDIIDAEIKNAQDKANQAFQSVSDGKTLVAGAITDKGVNTSPTDTFQVMADNIEAIVTDPSIGTTDAVAADVLSGKKVVSQGNMIEGTMPNRGPAEAETVNLTEQNQEYTIQEGHHTGLRKIKAVIAGLVAGVIKAGETVGGIAGNFTADATATAARMLAGYTAYVNGLKVTGTISSKGAQTYTPATTNQVISANQYLSGNQTIQGSANFMEENIKNGVNLWGKVGIYEGENIALSTAPSSDMLVYFYTQSASIPAFDSSTTYTTVLKVTNKRLTGMLIIRIKVDTASGGQGSTAQRGVRLLKNGTTVVTENGSLNNEDTTMTVNNATNPGDFYEVQLRKGILGLSWVRLDSLNIRGEMLPVANTIEETYILT